jgi:hypothetical protein
VLLVVGLSQPPWVSAAALGVSTARLTAFARTYGAARSCTLSAVADAYVNKALATTNFGTAATLLANADSTATARSFVRFDLSTCSPAIPSEALVQSAKVQLTVSLAAPASRTYQLRRVTAAWLESTINWNAQPASAGSVTASTSVTIGTLAGTVVEWPVTGDVQSYVTGTLSDLGWRLADSAEGIALGTPITFGSREAASGQPHLVLTYLP